MLLPIYNVYLKKLYDSTSIKNTLLALSKWSLVKDHYSEMFAELLSVWHSSKFHSWFGEDGWESSKEGSPVNFCLRELVPCGQLWMSLKSVPGLNLAMVSTFWRRPEFNTILHVVE